MGKIFIDSFSADVADLKRGCRTDENIIKALAKNPLVSTFDMSSNTWLWKSIERLVKSGNLKEIKMDFPWHKYEVINESINPK